MKKLLSVLFLLSFTLASVYAQNIQVKGTVVSGSDNEPLPGVNVVVKGTTNGGITDLDGNFTLSVPADATLSITYIGFRSQEVAVNGKTSLKIVLQEDSETLDEVVVVGYGVQKKSVVTASIAKVSSEDLENKSPVRMDNALKGLAAGVDVTSASGQPGDSPRVRIRGIGTINNSDPLYIVDGMPIGGGLDFVNPNDIESIEVLKDASASIYGIGAANGVVLITTKKGTETRPQITYEGNYSIVKNYPYLEPLSGEEYMNVANIFNKENYLFTNGMCPYGDKPFDNKWVPQFSPQQIAAAQTTDWLDCVLKDGSINNHNITITGGSKLLKYYLSGNYYKQEGTVENSAMERYALRTNISSQLLPFLKLTAIVNVNENEYTNSTSGGGGGGNGYDAIQSALTYPSYLPIRGEDGKPTLYSNYPNPAEMIKVSDRTKTSGYYLNFAADVDIIKDMLSFRLMYGINKENANRNLYIPSDIYFMDMYKKCQRS